MSLISANTIPLLIGLIALLLGIKLGKYLFGKKK